MYQRPACLALVFGPSNWREEPVQDEIGRLCLLPPIQDPPPPYQWMCPCNFFQYLKFRHKNKSKKLRRSNCISMFNCYVFHHGAASTKKSRFAEGRLPPTAHLVLSPHLGCLSLVAWPRLASA